MYFVQMMDLSRSTDSQGYMKNSPLTLNYPRTGEGHLSSSPYSHSKETAKEILNSQGLLNTMALNFSPKVEGQQSSFPYGLSGVAMPNYAYTGDLYQFTSNGYPRKSRTCSYCSKVFTRSTTRRYHEKRCPRLRAAVCGIVQDDDKKSKVPQLPSPHGRNNIDSSTSGYEKLSGKAHPASTSKFKGEDSIETHSNAIFKRDSEHMASLYAEKSRELMAESSHPMSDLHAALAAYKHSHFRSMSLSPFHLGAAMDYNKSPSRTSSGQRDDQESISNDEATHANGSDGENADKARSNANHESTKLMGEDSIKTEQNNNGENGEQTGLDIKCGVCGKMFASSWQLHVHEQIHTKFKPYACRFCGERFSKAALRIQHERIHEEVKSEDQPMEDQPIVVCAICGTQFDKKEDLRSHVYKFHQVGPWLCRQCGKASISHQDLYDHLKEHELPANEDDSLKIIYDIASGNVMEGNLNGTNEDIEEEDIEGESDSNENLTSPEQESPTEPMSQDGEADTNEEKEMCNVCGRDIPKSRMGLHLKSHEGQKPYECPICKKRFGYKNNMKSHIKLHDGIKPYQCNICGAKFTRGSTLRRHARRHGISAESVWDLFVKNDTSQSGHLGRENHKSDLLNMTGSPMSDLASSKYTDSSPYGTFNSLYNLPTSVAMTNALFMNYHNQAMASSMFPLPTTSDIRPSSAAFDTSSHESPQKDALNLSVNKHDMAKDNEIQSPTSYLSRSRSYSGSDIKTGYNSTKYVEAGVQVRSCCKMGLENPLSSGGRSPSEASIQSGESGSGANLAALENSTDNIATLLSTGKLFKCEPCEFYFSEYAMYRIHSKIHPGGKAQPFLCPVCNEDCHDKVYFSLHLAEHLH